ncbi:MAG: PAS domain-containing sensor histidine kinase [Tatlockia sp.]|nr:PAS domain-containing sensor histidine kinase [Tatlockia sp.]
MCLVKLWVNQSLQTKVILIFFIVLREEFMKKNSRSQTQDLSKIALNNMIANMPGHVYWKNKEGVYLGCNNRQAKSLGFSYGSEIIGKTDFDLPWKKEVANLFRENDIRIMESEQTEIVEEKSQVDGKEAIMLSQKTPLWNNKGEVVGILGISTDITDRKEFENSLRFAKEAAEAANQAKTEFLANMRHDIRTPLTGIVGFSEILKSESKEPRIKEYADNLVASSKALLNLMNEVLEAVRVSSGEIPMLKRKFNLANTVEQVMALYQARAKEKELNLSHTLDIKLPQFVIGDKIRVHRVLMELISNALNFTDNGYVTVKVELAKQKDRELVIRMIVSDSGLGIPKDKQQDIYVQFKRLTPSYQGIYKGAGLGLYVVKQFIDELGGEIYVDSEPRKGTCFTCLIPLQEPLLDDDSGIAVNGN